MPRAKKLSKTAFERSVAAHFKSHPDKPLFQPSTLQSHDVNALITCLHGAPNAAEQGKLVDEVGTVLAVYRALITHEGESAAASKVATLSPLLKIATDLRQGFMDLPQAVRMEIQAPSEQAPVSDTELDRICDALEQTIERHAREQRTGHPSTKAPLAQTVQGLQGVFAAYFRGETEARAKAETDFIHVALSSAGISHPDPDARAHELRKLMISSTNS